MKSLFLAAMAVVIFSAATVAAEEAKCPPGHMCFTTTFKAIGEDESPPDDNDTAAGGSGLAFGVVLAPVGGWLHAPGGENLGIYAGAAALRLSYGKFSVDFGITAGGADDLAFYSPFLKVGLEVVPKKFKLHAGYAFAGASTTSFDHLAAHYGTVGMSYLPLSWLELGAEGMFGGGTWSRKVPGSTPMENGGKLDFTITKTYTGFSAGVMGWVRFLIPVI